MSGVRRCSRTACGQTAVSTLTYVYADQTAVLGPLALYAEPHAYDLCELHSQRLSAPQGWDVVRLPRGESQSPSEDELLALANAVREAAAPRPQQVERDEFTAHVGTRRGHLTALRPPQA